MGSISLEYLAGLIDGEGSIGIAIIKTRYSLTGFHLKPFMSINMVKDEGVLKEIAEQFDGSIYQRKGGSIQLAFPERVIRKLVNILPVRIKRQQFEIMHRFIKNMDEGMLRYGGRPRPLEFWQKQVDLANQIRLLNQKRNVTTRVIESFQLRDIRKPTKLPIVSKAELIELYVNQKLSQKGIGKIKGCSKNTITKYMKLYGIPARNTKYRKR